MEKKQIIRKKVNRALEMLSEKSYTKWSFEIALHLISSTYWKKANVIAFTISRGREVDTYYLIRKAWEEGKRVVVPRANFKTRLMTFYEITRFDHLEERPYSLKEPMVKYCSSVNHAEIDLVIVPGLAFDKNGYRLGFGGGFYDRFLPTVDAITISLAFPCQIVQELPIEKHDRKVDHIISPSGFY
ncbi:5-formyltetrahydrofolate cyclo-ligase [Halalkalibacter kiskunsagensis]|uniref:5-formyltetrahydrofolate cyclo-ligase n=1 Tax=Halalkalibacter kiskunsagensis TaxID=1548599 RepID=A0ABV6KKD6_9BACI